MSDEKNINNSDEISLKELILKIRAWRSFIVSKWIVILIVSLLGSALGLTYALIKRPVYTAELTFSLQDEKSGSGLGSALGLANQLGIDVGGGSAGGEFSGDNLLELMKSRNIVQKAMLSTVIVADKNKTLAEFYIEINDFRQAWKKNPALNNIHFLPGETAKLTLVQDSLLGIFHKALIKDNFTVTKIDKNLSIISLKISSNNELFSKYFAEVLTEVVSDFYIQTKTSKAAKNVAILQKQTDSVRTMLYAAISGVAISNDAAPNANPLLQTLRVPSQRKQVDVTANTAILAELERNLEISKMSLLQETPLIQIIDRPTLPLDKDKVGKLKAIVFGGFLAAFLTIICLSLNRVYRAVMI